MAFWIQPDFSISERVDPGKPDMAGRKKLKESASHHLKPICSGNCYFFDFGLTIFLYI